MADQTKEPEVVAFTYRRADILSGDGGLSPRYFVLQDPVGLPNQDVAPVVEVEPLIRKSDCDAIKAERDGLAAELDRLSKGAFAKFQLEQAGLKAEALSATLRAQTLAAKCAELERRLEVDGDAPDGIDCRDETIRQLKRELAADQEALYALRQGRVVDAFDEKNKRIRELEAQVRALQAGVDYVTRRLQADIDDGSRPDQWSMEDMVRKLAAAPQPAQEKPCQAVSLAPGAYPKAKPRIPYMPGPGDEDAAEKLEGKSE